jgi:hypothetical protein
VLLRPEMAAPEKKQPAHSGVPTKSLVVEEGGPVIQAVLGDGMDRQLAKSGQPVGWPREPLGCLGVVADALIGVRPFVAAARVRQEPIAEIGEVVSLDGRAALMGSIDHIRATPALCAHVERASAPGMPDGVVGVTSPDSWSSSLASRALRSKPLLAKRWQRYR